MVDPDSGLVEPVDPRFELYLRAMTGVFWLLGILASAVPLSVLRDTVEPFAGRATVVDANIALTATASASVVLNGFQFVKVRQQRRELERVRDRIERQGWERP